MARFANPTKVGLRDRVTRDLVAVYPKIVKGTDEVVYKEVQDWYYKQSCSAENELNNLFVDTITDSDFETGKHQWS